MAIFTREQARINLNGLIKKYEGLKDNKDFCKNESQIAESLIKPFVNVVLGYDTTNPSEFKVQTSMGGKRSDMLICLNGVTQFVIEAKALTHNIRKDYQYYQQAIQYASYKEKKFAILTNFKQFAILDAEIITEPLKAEVAFIDLESQKNEDFDILWAFSKEVWQQKGENNEILLKLKGKKKQKIDEQLLDDLKRWRELLLNSLKKHPQKNKYDFDKDIGKIEEEVQKFIDRLVFICYCEDKQLMDVELNPIIHEKEEKHWDKEWHALGKTRKLFEDYLQKYNSDLFNESWCDKFYFDDNTLLKVLKDLRQPKGKQPYDFSIIEADILGKTYENFIGHVIAGEKRFKEKESKGKRKSEGIYYTPTYIVDYIVRNTVLEYVNGKSIASINKVKILDPACGSGSFLIKAYDALVEECEKIRKLNYEEKKDLMLNCIFGVDKDERAVEICKLNLSLKLAETGKKLPEFHNNIKCGDSLIDDENIAGDKAFNWNEKFKSIMDNGGFDVVIGNPPYIPIEMFSENFKNYYFSNFESPYRKFDSVILFIEKGINLLKSKGLISFIVPQTWETGENYGKFRNFVFSKCALKYVINLPFDVFADAYIDTCIFILGKDIKSSTYSGYSFEKKTKIDKIDDSKFQEIDYKVIENEPTKKVFIVGTTYKIFEKTKNNTILLGDITDSCQGVVVSKFPIKNSKINENYKKLLTVGVGDRYYFDIKETKFIDYGKSIGLYKYYSQPRIFIRRLINRRNRLMAFIYEEPLITKKDYNPFIITNSSFNLKYLLSLINSKLFSYLYTNKSTLALKDDFRQTTLQEVRQLPIKNISLDKQLPFIKLADKMLSLNKKLQEIGDKNTLEKQKIEQEIKKTDNEIDELVYQLYGITEEEKKIIEESLR